MPYPVKGLEVYEDMVEILLILQVFLAEDLEIEIYVPHRRGGAHIVSGADPVGVGFSVSVTLSCLHDIS